MKRIYTILSCLLLAGMLCIGLYALLDKDATYSESERRKLKTRPKLTFSAMLDGSYASDYRDYFADTFPNREKLMNANRSLNGFYYFSGGSKDGAQLVINMNGGAANHGEALPTTDDKTPSSSTQPSGTSGTATDSTEPTEPTQPTQTQDPDAAAEELGSVLVVGDRAMEVPYGDKDTIRSYADAVNDIAAKLGSGVRTFSIAVPNAAAFYAPAENQHMLQTDMIAACYDRLKELKSTAIAVDAYSKLEAHKDEYLYFRSDHHWTALGAYYAYTAFCESAGLKAEPLSKFESGEYTGFLGSLYSAIKAYPQSQALADNPDTVQLLAPVRRPGHEAVPGCGVLYGIFRRHALQGGRYVEQIPDIPRRRPSHHRHQDKCRRPGVHDPQGVLRKRLHAVAHEPLQQDHRHRSARIQPRRQAEPRSGCLCEGTGRERLHRAGLSHHAEFRFLHHLARAPR